jgi:selenide, water dikinase
MRHLTVVGGGAGGVELMLAMQHRLAALLDAQRFAACGFALVTDAPRLLASHPPAASRALARIFSARRISVMAGSKVIALTRAGENTQLQLDSGTTLVTDLAVWVTGARATPWIKESGVAADPQGFMLIDASLRALNDVHLFGSGDCATSQTDPRPKSGVYAVKQGPLLARNLRAALAGAALETLTPPAIALALISTGNRGAVAVRGNWTMPFMQTLQWHWKDKIDRGWMAKYSPDALARLKPKETS